MKVYVDDNEDYIITYSSRDRSECLESMGMQPIIVESLSDYTKQVRKEVCEEIKQKIEKRNNSTRNANYSTEYKDGYSGCCCDIEDVLDQIQGENNG